jgi:hypothetical protein
VGCDVRGAALHRRLRPGSYPLAGGRVWSQNQETLQYARKLPCQRMPLSKLSCCVMLQANSAKGALQSRSKVSWSPILNTGGAGWLLGCRLPTRLA